MLTGDKAETAVCIGRSARLVDRGQEVFPIIVANARDAQTALDQFGGKPKTPLVIDGPSLQVRVGETMSVLGVLVAAVCVCVVLGMLSVSCVYV